MPGVTGSLRRGVLVLSVMVLAVLLVAEGATRALEPPDPLVYGDEATQVKVSRWTPGARRARRPGGQLDGPRRPGGVLGR
jgi:hypothetical protein